jgi:hypothetical protein
MMNIRRPASAQTTIRIAFGIIPVTLLQLAGLRLLACSGNLRDEIHAVAKGQAWPPGMVTFLLCTVKPLKVATTR